MRQFLKISVADPDPNRDPAPPDPHVLGLLDMVPIHQSEAWIRIRFGSGSGSFYHQAKKVRKTLIPTAL